MAGYASSCSTRLATAVIRPPPDIPISAIIKRRKSFMRRLRPFISPRSSPISPLFACRVLPLRSSRLLSMPILASGWGWG